MENAMGENSAADESPELAFFSDRFLAFWIDLAVFALGYWATLQIGYRSNPELNPRLFYWPWLAFFILYQAWASSGGRASLGKSLLGLRVIGPEGQPLSLPMALVRALGLIVSSTFFLGFIWPLFSRRLSGWHDLMAGSRVIELEPKSPYARRLVFAGALAAFALLAGAWSWRFALGPSYRRVMDVSYAHVGLRHLAKLEERHRRSTGIYTADLLALAGQSGDPNAFLVHLAGLVDPAQGVNITLHGNQGYTIAAVARDYRRTPVRYTVQ